MDGQEKIILKGGRLAGMENLKSDRYRDLRQIMSTEQQNGWRNGEWKKRMEDDTKARSDR